jgi:hypothetical protein
MMSTLLKFAICVAGIGSIAALPAEAGGWHGRGFGHGHGFWHGHGHGFGHGSPRIGVFIGGPAFFPPPRVFHPRPALIYAPPVIYSAPVWSPPVVYSAPRIIYSEPPVYIERNDLQRPQYVQPPVSVAPQAPPPPQVSAAAPPAFDWFFCVDSNTFYPYVRECATPWQRVPAQPSSIPR